MARKLNKPEVYVILTAIVDITINKYNNVDWVMSETFGFENICRMCLTKRGHIEVVGHYDSEEVGINISGCDHTISLWHLDEFFNNEVDFEFEPLSSSELDNFLDLVRKTVLL